MRTGLVLAVLFLAGPAYADKCADMCEAERNECLRHGGGDMCRFVYGDRCLKQCR